MTTLDFFNIIPPFPSRWLWWWLQKLLLIMLMKMEIASPRELRIRGSVSSWFLLCCVAWICGGVERRRTPELKSQQVAWKPGPYFERFSITQKTWEMSQINEKRNRYY